MIRLHTSSRRFLTALVVAGIAPALAMPTAAAGAGLTSATPGNYQHTLLAKAQPDECFVAPGLPYPPGPPCAEGQPKVNQSYVWGLAKAGPNLWFGTGANVLCLRPPNYQGGDPTLSDDLVCEFGHSQPAQANPDLPAALGDHRPPEVWVYNLPSRKLTDRSGDIAAASAQDATLLETTGGLRSGVAHQGVVLLAGPGLSGGIHMFAFDARSGKYLGATALPEYQNIRHFVVAEGVLYAGVGIGVNGGEGGKVLRWTGNRDNPFAFTVVGELGTQAADLAVHDGRLFVTTWPETVFDAAIESGVAAGVPARSYTGSEAGKGLAGVWMSPRLKDGDPGLTAADAAGWSEVWNVGGYEPDPIVARATALGGIASYQGKLYWGTMHVPLQATAAHLAIHPPKTPEQLAATRANTQRAFAVFQGSGFGAEGQHTEVLYGEAALPAFDAAANGGAGAWQTQPTGYTPKFGKSGFGDPYNLYAWKMAVTGGRLYVGTMDFRYIAMTEGASAASGSGYLGSRVLDEDPALGADLWAFTCVDSAAEPVTTDGFGNMLNQGVRTIVTDGPTLYLGMANPMNLATELDDDKPEGGWELIKVTARR